MLLSSQIWQVQKSRNYFNRPGGQNEKTWATRSFVQISRLKEVERLVEELKIRLKNLGIHVPHRSGTEQNTADSGLILKVWL